MPRFFQFVIVLVFMPIYLHKSAAIKDFSFNIVIILCVIIKTPKSQNVNKSIDKLTDGDYYKHTQQQVTIKQLSQSPEAAGEK